MKFIENMEPGGSTVGTIGYSASPQVYSYPKGQAQKRKKHLATYFQYMYKIRGGCFWCSLRTLRESSFTYWYYFMFVVFTLYIITMIQDVNLVPPNMDNLYFTADELSCLLQNYDNLSNEERRCFDFYMVNLKVLVIPREGRGHWTVCLIHLFPKF